MPDPARDVVAIGECMVELARGNDQRYALSYGGDTFNTVVYLARCGVRVRYATAVGDDPYSVGIRDLAAREGVGTDLIATVPGRMPGLYLIETTAAGERTFHYWRDRSPAREIFDTDARHLCAAMHTAGLVYLSGITLSLYTPAALDRFAAALIAAKANGVRIAMDGNYRPRGWGGDTDRARGVLARFWGLADVALPTFEDEAMLWGDADAIATIERLRAHGVGEVVVKQGAAGALTAEGATVTHVAIPTPVTAIDTSAAGDSFNAAYLAARAAGHSAASAALHGHRLAGIVVQHRGALAPPEATRAATVIAPA